MYQPSQFKETNEEAMRRLICSAPLATIIINTENGLVANHIPFVLSGEALASSELHAHIPRANPLTSLLATETPCLVIFHGPEGYISPSYYATKPQHGKVVPTWNYAVVHVHGVAQIVDAPAWVLKQMNLLTTLNESTRSAPWAVSDAPEEFIESLLKSLVGIKVSIDRFEGKTKASQNQPDENKASVLAALDNQATDDGLADLMHSVLEQ